MRAKSDWGDARMEVMDSGKISTDSDFPGFPDKETALMYLTQPMSGHFYLNQATPKQLGCWEIYHVPMNPNIGTINPDRKHPNFFKVFQ